VSACLREIENDTHVALCSGVIEAASGEAHSFVSSNSQLNSLLSESETVLLPGMFTQTRNFFSGRCNI